MSRLGGRYQDAFAFASGVHVADVRKGTEIPYVAHLLAVTVLVIEDGGSEDEAIAALLHDAAEDHGGEAMLATIAERFGDVVAAIVAGCSDALVPEGQDKGPWRARKERYLTHLETASTSVLRVSNADKLHNARAILSDYDAMGDRLWSRFSAPADEQIWYYRSLADVFKRRRYSRLASELDATVTSIEGAVNAGNGSRSDVWLERVILERQRWIDAMLETADMERTMTAFATSDYDWELLVTDHANRAQETVHALEAERDWWQEALRYHRTKWSEET